MTTRRERPRGCSAAEQGYERAPFHSITSSASASNLSGTMSILLTLGQFALFTPGGCPKVKLELDDARPKTQLRDAK